MNEHHEYSRRGFLGKSLFATALFGGIQNHGIGQDTVVPPAAAISRKIKLGVVGLGGRGAWIAGLFRAHGGYDIHAVADYFPAVVGNHGNALGVDPARRFSGLSGYKKVIDSGVEAIVIIDVPYFYPEQSRAAVEAGLHVYMAKPVAVDVPGVLSIAVDGKTATQKQRVFMVDYQIPTDPMNIGVIQRIHDGNLGKLAQVQTFGISAGFNDPPKSATIESRLRGLIWVNDTALGGDNIVNYDIHAIDAALWGIGQRPVAAMGSSRTCREAPHGDGRDVTSVVYEYADGLVHNHFGQALKNQSENSIRAVFHSTQGNAQVIYVGKAFVSGGAKSWRGGEVVNLYKLGAERNIATFYQDICAGKTDNPTVQRAVDGALTCILGREAAARHGKLTMEELIKENKKLEVDLQGLQA